MPDPVISDLLKSASRPLLSLEFFPPKDEQGWGRFEANAERLAWIQPDFVTCTWGAGGSTREKTLKVCQRLHELDFAPVMPHLTCVGVSKQELRDIADEIYDLGFRNIMTLRGDPPSGASTFEPHPDGLAYAGELVTLLKEQHSDFCCGVAGYPEKHPEAASLEDDIRHLKQKVDAGADFITTQLFFDNDCYKKFLQLCWDAGISIPILPGILPAMSLKQVDRFTKLCGSTFPDELAQQMDAAGGTGAGAEDVGLAWAANQIDDLIDNGAPGIHLYVLNRSRAAMAPALKRSFDRTRQGNG